MLKKENHSHPFLEGFLIGSTLGAATVFMIGTKKGKELRKEIFHKYQIMQPQIKHLKSYLMHAKKSLLHANIPTLLKKTVKRKTRKTKSSKRRR